MSVRRFVVRPAMLLLLALISTPVKAMDVLTKADRTAVIDATVSRLTSTYVDESDARRIAAALRARETAGAYENITNPAQFAEVVTRDLRSVNGDLHLGLRYSGDASPRGPRSGSPFGDPKDVNFGMGRAAILDGNVGYLEITGFTGGEYEDAVVDALRFLSRADAVIIDLRRNGGGASDMSHFIFSHFLGERPVPTIDVRTRRSPEAQHRLSVGAVPGPRRTTVPLYVLTSQGTASAAEEFAFVLKNKKRAVIVGSRTAGAGHMVTQLPIGNGFTVSLSITRVSDPETGLEWEQVGVQPDIAVPVEQALDRAHAAALKMIMRDARDGQKSATLARLIETVDARIRDTRLDPKQLPRFAGTYDDRVVSVRDGRLWYSRRAGGLSEELIPLGGDAFALAALRFQFAESGGSATLTVEQADGTKVTLARAASRTPGVSAPLY